MIWNPLLTADTDTAHCGNSVGVLRKVRSSSTVSVKLAHYTDTLERRLVNRQETGSGLRVKRCALHSRQRGISRSRRRDDARP